MTKYHESGYVGGTFTDLVVASSEELVCVGSISTTLNNSTRGVIKGIEELASDLSDVDFIGHETEVGLNAFTERRCERGLPITTAGARDNYVIARGNRHALYELLYSKPDELVPRRDVHEVRGRISWDSAVIEPLNHPDFEPIIEYV